MSLNINWIKLTTGEVINLDYISTIQKDTTSFKIWFVLGTNLGDGTSGSNAIVEQTFADANETNAAFNQYIGFLAAQGKLHEVT